MSTSQFAVIVGLTLGIVAVEAGIYKFAIVVLFALGALVVGRYLEGKIDLRSFSGRATDRR